MALDPQLSVSRIGSRAYHPAMEALAPQVRGASLVLACMFTVHSCGRPPHKLLVSPSPPAHLNAHPPSLPPPCQVRLDLAQAVDAARYSASMDDPAAERALLRASLVAAALPQVPHASVPLERQVVQLLALLRGFLDGVPPEEAAARLEALTDAVVAAAPAAAAEVADTKRLSATAEAALLAALEACSGVPRAPSSAVA